MPLFVERHMNLKGSSYHSAAVRRAMCRVHRDIESLQARAGESARQGNELFQSMLSEVFFLMKTPYDRPLRHFTLHPSGTSRVRCRDRGGASAARAAETAEGGMPHGGATRTPPRLGRARGRVRAEGVRLTFPTLWANLWAWTTKPIHNDFGIPIHLGVLFKYSWYSSP